MGTLFRKIAIFPTIVFLALCSGCLNQDGQTKGVTPLPDQSNNNTNTNSSTRRSSIKTSDFPSLQRQILDKKYSTTKSQLGSFDFKNYTYLLPRGWQDRDGKELVLENGKRQMTEEKIGMSYVTTKFFDVTGDGEDEAFVILKVDTGSITIPQIVYIYEWKNDQPEMIWYFRTGDRSDGGLKRIYPEDGDLMIELFGRDRYIFSQMETGKITGDEEQLCCPTHFTRNRYKRKGSSFVLDSDSRWTYSLTDTNAKPVRNMNEKKLKEERG